MTSTREETTPEDVKSEIAPWQLPQGLAVAADPLRLRLDIHEDSIILQEVHEDSSVTVRPVSAVDISRVLTLGVTFHSGLLPPNALWWQRSREGVRLALWRPPARTHLALQTAPFEPPRRFHIPMPGLVFLCQSGRAPYVWAASKRPRRPQDRLYHCPTFNVYADGLSCQGTHQYPLDVEQVPESFFQSLFTPAAGMNVPRSKKYGSDVLALWEWLGSKRSYPVRDLVEWGPVKRLFEEVR